MVGPDGELLRLGAGALLLLDGVEHVAVRNVGDVPRRARRDQAPRPLTTSPSTADAAPDEVLGHVAEPDHQLGRLGGPLVAVAAHPVDAHAPARRAVDDGGLADAGRAARSTPWQPASSPVSSTPGASAASASTSTRRRSP